MEKTVNCFTHQEGLDFFQEKWPQIQVYYVAMDDHLDENKYIVPGCGDFGDNEYGT